MEEEWAETLKLEDIPEFLFTPAEWQELQRKIKPSLDQFLPKCSHEAYREAMQSARELSTLERRQWLWARLELVEALRREREQSRRTHIAVWAELERLRTENATLQRYRSAGDRLVSTAAPPGTTCHQCGGTGGLDTDGCPRCKGNGYEPQDVS